MVWYEIVENFKKTITFIYDVIKYYNCLFVWMGTQAAKGEGLKILWHRPPRVIIFDYALVAQVVERYLGKVEVGGSNPP